MLLVAPLIATDVDAARALMLHPQVRGPLFMGPHPLSAEILLQRTYFVGRLQRGGPLVGVLGLHAEGLSYAVDPELWGRGLGREMLRIACHALAPAAGLACLQALVQRDNVRSRRLLERAGFRFAGVVGPPLAGAAAVLRYAYRISPPARPAAAGLQRHRESSHGTSVDRRQEA